MGKDAKEEAHEKALHGFCEEIRRKGGVPWRTAIVDDDRKDFFRGKDLQRYVEAHPGKLEGIVDTGRSQSHQIKRLVEHMLEAQAVVACDRFYKRPHPGRKRLVKFPRKLAPYHRRDQGWDPENFYIWLEDRPMPPWQYALAVLMAVGILVVCLFPLAPYWLRISVVYFFLGLLCSIFALILVRFLVFLTVFAFTGYEFWLFPNLLSDQVDILGAFVPLLTFQKPEDGKSHLGTRIGGFLGVGFMMYVFYVYTPDESTLTFERANESILDMFNNQQKPGLGPGAGYVPPKFGNDRNIDVEKIRQAQLNEKQRLKEEAAKRRRAAAEGVELNDTSSDSQQFPHIPDEAEIEAEDDEGPVMNGTDASAGAGDDDGGGESPGEAEGAPEAATGGADASAGQTRSEL